MDTEQNNATSDVLGNITSFDAMSILRVIIERHKELRGEICKIAKELLGDVDPDDIASDVNYELNSIEVEELWHRSGATSYGYKDPSEESWVMFEEVLEPFIDTMEKYQKMGLTKDAKSYCIGIIRGIQEYETTSNSEFKDWAVDAPNEYIDTVLEKWKVEKPSQSDIAEVEWIINNESS